MNAPKWQKIVETQYNSEIANAFMFTGNIGDYARETVLLRDYLSLSSLFFGVFIRSSFSAEEYLRSTSRIKMYQFGRTRNNYKRRLLYQKGG